jgi:hypothetical protein
MVLVAWAQTHSAQQLHVFPLYLWRREAKQRPRSPMMVLGKKVGDHAD